VPFVTLSHFLEKGQRMTRQNLTNPQVSLPEFTAVAGKIGLLSFGGPAAQIALMQDELVDKRGWISQADAIGHLCGMADAWGARRLDWR
jgi:hypothetical protein